jgi:SdrD B-like domain
MREFTTSIFTIYYFIMMRYILSIALLQLVLCPVLLAQIGGYVYRDFNANGLRDSSSTFYEVGVANVNVSVFDSTNILIGTATTSGAMANLGNYFVNIASGKQVRVEFSNYPNGDFEGDPGLNNNSNSQFATSGLGQIVNFRINYPEHFSQPNPSIVMPIITNGGLGSGIGNAISGLKKFRYNDGSNWQNAVGGTSLTSYNNLGNTWGIAYNRRNNALYVSTFLKRHAAVKDHNSDGYGDLGAIYQTDTLGTMPTLLLDLHDFGIDVGQSGMPLEADRLLHTPTDLNIDPLVFDFIGKVGIGGIDLSEDGNTLYAINLYEKTLCVFNIVGTPTLVGEYPLPNPCNNSQGNLRPFSVKSYRGEVYVGIVCDASISQNLADLTASVYKFDGTGFGSQLFSTLVLNFDRDCALDNTSACVSNTWSCWQNAYFSQGASTVADVYTNTHQPILSDLEFDVNGDLILGFADRTYRRSSVCDGRYFTCSLANRRYIHIGIERHLWGGNYAGFDR